jgi:hypothetical protein
MWDRFRAADCQLWYTVDVNVWGVQFKTARNVYISNRNRIKWVVYGRSIVYWNGRVNEGAQRQMYEHTMNDA